MSVCGEEWKGEREGERREEGRRRCGKREKRGRKLKEGEGRGCKQVACVWSFGSKQGHDPTKSTSGTCLY